MFDIGFPELMLLSVIALLVLGPERLPQALRTLGRTIGQLRRSYEGLMREIEREVALDEIKKEFEAESQAIQSEVNTIHDSFKGEVDAAMLEAEANLTDPDEHPDPDQAAGEPADEPGDDEQKPRNGAATVSEPAHSSPPEDPPERHPDDVAVDEAEQPLVAHLLELRTRLLRSLAAVFILLFPLLAIANELYLYLSEPLRRYLPEDSSMIATEVASPFLTPFKLAIFTALFLAMPYILHQAWGFIAPGLYRREKRFAMPLLVSSIVLFYAGMAFAFYVVFPLVFAFFTSVAPEGVTVMTDINRYLDFVLKLFLAFGLAFEIPIATLLLVLTGLSTVDSLSAKRPYVVVGCFAIGMLLTPPDVISQVLLALPMWLLFEFGIIFCRLAGLGEQKDEEDDGAAAT